MTFLPQRRYLVQNLGILELMPPPRLPFGNHRGLGLLGFLEELSFVSSIHICIISYVGLICVKLSCSSGRGRLRLLGGFPP
jgi:hypothetical protein